MDLGFETIGNATLIAYDRRPVLVTDPWIDGAPYFGSWALPHQVPQEQRAAIRAAEFVWISHGHPDHLDPTSITELRGKKILLPAHVGGRIRRDLEAQSHEVHVLPVGEWVPLSDRIRVICFPDYNQDAVLLVDVGGALLVNLNDAAAYAWGRRIKREIGKFSRSFLLQLAGYGDTDMMNFHDEAGSRITPPAVLKARAGVGVGHQLSRIANAWGVTDVVPFSAMHRYCREDSRWADAGTTPIDAYAKGFEADGISIRPAYVHCDLARNQLWGLEPGPAALRVRAPSEYGDDWSELLEADEVELATRYFQSIQHLSTFLDYVNLRVGGRDNPISLGKGSKRGLTFEVPRHSLVASLRYQVFDDLLIGNFMKTTLHGRWPNTGLKPHFSAYVSKYADNGGARSRQELRAYFAEYRRRVGAFGWVYHCLATRAVGAFRSRVAIDTPLYDGVRRAYWFVRRSFP